MWQKKVNVKRVRFVKYHSLAKLTGRGVPGRRDRLGSGGGHTTREKTGCQAKDSLDATGRVSAERPQLLQVVSSLENTATGG